MAASITSASQPCARKKAMNAPTTASKKRVHSGDAAKRGDESDGAAHRSDRLLGEAEVVVVGVGHRAHHEVRQPVKADGRQHHKREPAMCAEESDEWSHDSVEETGP